MQVDVRYRNDPERGLTDPLPELGGRRFVMRVYSGDVCDPLFGNWFTPPWPKYVVRFKFRFLPFVAWKWPLINRAGYIGFKLYGADAEAYKNWMPAEDVYDGSQALCFSVRPAATIT